MLIATVSTITTLPGEARVAHLHPRDVTVAFGDADPPDSRRILAPSAHGNGERKRGPLAALAVTPVGR
jgi:hypothetical protein